MFLSVVIPVYNAERYLAQCIESVRMQTWEDYEVILVDDGSCDSSRALCSSYCARDARFRLIEHDRNRGASAARNTGLAAARADYVMFLDNDDWIDGREAFARVHDAVVGGDGPDVVCYPMGDSYAPWDEATFAPHSYEGELKACAEIEDKLMYMIRNGLYYSSASGKTVRRALIEGNGLCFDERLKHNEDTEWSRRLLGCLGSVAWIDEGFYVYRRNSGVSQSARPDPAKVMSSLSEIVGRHVRSIEDGVLAPPRSQTVSQFVAYAYVLLLSYAYRGNGEAFMRERAAQRRNAWLLDFDVNRRVALVRRSYKAIGAYATGKLLAWVMESEQRALLKRKTARCS